MEKRKKTFTNRLKTTRTYNTRGPIPHASLRINGTSQPRLVAVEHTPRHTRHRAPRANPSGVVHLDDLPVAVGAPRGGAVEVLRGTRVEKLCESGVAMGDRR